MKYAISSCLMGVDCKYNGGNNRHEKLIRFMDGNNYHLLCPELLGGLSTPRACCEIVDGRVMNTNHEDLSDAFHIGAMKSVEIIRQEKVDLVITQSRSPSCGKGYIYNGRFTGEIIKGNGIFVAMCEDIGIDVIDVEEFINMTEEFAGKDEKKRNCHCKCYQNGLK